MIQVAKILKSNGTDGELVMSFSAVDPSDINLKEPVFIYFDGLPVPFFVESLVRRGSAKALVRLNDIENAEDAEELVGRAVFVDSQDEEQGEEDFSFLIGWSLYNGSVCVGRVADFLDIPGNPCLELESGAIVPLHEDLLIGLDEGARTITMSLPEGLF